MAKQSTSEIIRVQTEVNQAPDTRAKYYRDLEKLFDASVFALFTSFTHPALLDDDDADMLEDALRNRPPKSKLLLVLESPGGRALAAERIIRICREYSGGAFEVVVPNQAKSAATMVCLGSDRVWMGPTSELGPINPQQVFVGPDGERKMVAVESIIKSYEALMSEARACEGNVEPYLLQLARYDAREVEELKSANELAKDIAVKALRSGMMDDLSERTVQRRIQRLTETAQTKSHGRPIYYQEAKTMGLGVRLMSKKSQKWAAVRRLYTRLDWQVTHNAAKMVETLGLTYSVPIPQEARTR